MKAVVNTSPVVWLDQIGEAQLITNVYDAIYTVPLIAAELSGFNVSETAKKVISKLVIPERILAEKKRFDRIVKRRKRKLNFKDIPDLEVLVAFQLFSDADEMLFANKDAENKFSRYGIVRDVARLYELAEQADVFSRADSIGYLKKLMAVDYRTAYVKKLLDKLLI